MAHLYSIISDETAVNKAQRFFLSTPMSGFNDPDKYRNFRKEILEIIDDLKLRPYCLDTYFAGSKEKNGSFSSHEESFSSDLMAIDSCDIFLLIYPEKISTSALIEIGYAIAKKKNILIFCRKIDDLPYLLKKFDQTYKPEGRIIVYKSLASIKTLLDDHFS